MRFDWGARRLRADRLEPHGRRGRAREGAAARLLEGPHARRVRRQRLDARAATTAPARTRRSTCRPTGRGRRRFQDRIQVSVQRMRGNDVVGAGTTIDVLEESRRIERGVAPGQWQSVGELRTGDSYSPASSCRARPPTSSRACPPRSTTEHMEDLSVRVHLRDDLTPAEIDALPSDVPTQPARQPPAGQRDGRLPAVRPPGRAGDRELPGLRPARRRRDGDARSRTSRETYGLAQRLKARAATPYEYALAVNDYLRRGFTYTEKPPAPAPGSDAARVVPVRHQGRLLPALLGRDGAAAADGRRARAGGDRLLARRLLQAQAGVDRPRHRRALLGGGVVRGLRLDHAGPDAVRHAGALADRLDRRSRHAAGRRRRTRRPTRTRAATPGGPARRRLARGAVQLAPRRRRDGDRGRRGRGLLRPAAVAADPGRRWCSPRSAPGSSCAAAAGARTTRSSAWSSSSRPRCGARAARRPPG